MARFELVLSIAKRSDNNELYTEDREYMCYCKDPRDIKEITETVNEIVHEEFEESIEGEVLFGSADVIVNDLTVLMLQYTNSELPKKEIDEIIDLLTEQQGAMH